MLSVLLATRSRARILGDVLEAYCHLQPPSSGWKLVVVDNCSTDETAQVIAAFANRLPLHYVLEPKLGKNHALNTGLGLVEGDLTVFTDDDAFPHADWLLQLRQAADAHPTYLMFGGAVVPRWEVPPPSWIQWVDLGTAYTITDPALEEGPIPPDLIFGPNMAVRTSVFRSGICFDPSIGPRGPIYRMGGETELLLRLGHRGHKAWHVQDAVVEHFVRGEQLEKDWVLQRAITAGRGRHYLSRTEVKLWMGLPRHLIRDIPKEGLFMALAWLSFKAEALFRAHWRFNVLRGKAIEACILAREQRTRAQLAHR